MRWWRSIHVFSLVQPKPPGTTLQLIQHKRSTTTTTTSGGGSAWTWAVVGCRSRQPRGITHLGCLDAIFCLKSENKEVVEWLDAWISFCQEYSNTEDPTSRKYILYKMEGTGGRFARLCVLHYKVIMLSPITYLHPTQQVSVPMPSRETTSIIALWSQTTRQIHFQRQQGDLAMQYATTKRLGALH